MAVWRRPPRHLTLARLRGMPPPGPVACGRRRPPRQAPLLPPTSTNRLRAEAAAGAAQDRLPPCSTAAGPAAERISGEVALALPAAARRSTTASALSSPRSNRSEHCFLCLVSKQVPSSHNSA